jgi:hypothetical protein
LDLELGYQGDKLNMTVFNGAVRTGSVTIRGGSEDSRTRSISAGRSGRRNEIMVPNPRVFVYPYFMYGDAAPIDGRIVPPAVNNPTHPGYRPTQIVPPMSDPLRVPVTKP